MHRMSLYRRCSFSASKGFRHQRFFQNPKSPGIILQKPAVWGSVVYSIMESAWNFGWILLKVLGLVIFLANKHNIHWCDSIRCQMFNLFKTTVTFAKLWLSRHRSGCATDKRLSSLTTNMRWLQWLLVQQRNRIGVTWITLPETSSSHLKIGHPERRFPSSHRINFQNLLVC